MFIINTDFGDPTIGTRLASAPVANVREVRLIFERFTMNPRNNCSIRSAWTQTRAVVTHCGLFHGEIFLIFIIDALQYQ